MKHELTLQRAFWAVFWVGLLLRILYIGFSGLELAPDEAYYWQWSRHLDWSYYSKGPLVAYLIFLGTSIGGHTEFGVRLPTVFLSAYTLYISYRLYRKLFPTDSLGPLLIALFYNTIPIFMVGSMIATIDPPLCALWLTGTYALYIAVEEQKPSGWALLALSLGLGILAKYTMLLFLFTPVFYLALSRENRVWLKRPHPYLAILGGLAFFLIPIIWNIQNQWVTLHHNMTLSKIDTPFVWYQVLWYFPEMILTQAAIISPILFIVLVCGMAVQTKKACTSENDRASFLLVCSFAPVLLFYTLLSIKRSINPNWIVVIYPAMILAASRFWSQRLEKGSGYRWIASGAALGVLLCFILLFSNVIHMLHLPLSQKWDPAARLKGWHEFASLTEKTKAMFAVDDRVFVFGNKYQNASELAFYIQGRPRTYSANDHPLANQYDIWGGSKEWIGTNAVFAARSKKKEGLYVPEHIAKSFERIEPGLEGLVERYGRVIRYHQTWKCYGFRGWAIKTELEQMSH